MQEPLPRTLFFNTQVNQDTVSLLTQRLIEINDSDIGLVEEAKLNGFIYIPSPIQLYIDSFGGSVYQVLGLVSVIERSTTPVHTICTGVAMSAGFILLISGHRRFCHKYSTLLYHQLSSWTVGTLKEMLDRTEEYKRLMGILENITLQRTKIKRARLKEVFDKQIDWYITPSTAKTLGIVDEIL